MTNFAVSKDIDSIKGDESLFFKDESRRRNWAFNEYFC